MLLVVEEVLELVVQEAMVVVLALKELLEVEKVRVLVDKEY